MSDIEKIKQLQLDYQITFGSEAGKRVLADLKTKGFENKTTFSKEQSVHAFREGGRAFLLDILIMLSMDIEQMEKTIKEREDNG